VDAKARYDELVDDLCARHDDVEPSQMMGMPCVKRGGKMVAGFTRSAMVFKLPDPDAHARALALDGAHLFDPSGENRPFKQWVVVPEGHAAEWESLSHEALKPAG
jgi:hypothetical protein